MIDELTKRIEAEIQLLEEFEKGARDRANISMQLMYVNQIAGLCKALTIISELKVENLKPVFKENLN